jgi:glucose/arabinose dehydrogenase
MRDAVPRGFALAAVLTLAACGSPVSGPPPATSFGAQPQLPEPHKRHFMPTVRIAPAVGWPEGRAPRPAAGFAVSSFAINLDHPRWLYVLPNGDVLVAETNAPPKPEQKRGLRSWIMGLVMKKAGAGVTSPNRITLLRDADGDGAAEVRTTFLQGLNSPFGMALVGDWFFVANADAIVRFPYTAGALSISSPPTKVAALPAGLNHHWTKNLIASPDGARLYVTVGSNSNVAERGMAIEKNRAAIHELDLRTGAFRLFASGLRNPNGMDWQPTSGELWTVVNERDEIGDDLVPDYLTSVKDGAFYGWPYSYYGQHVDRRVKPQDPAMVARAVPPDYALGAHTASLGLVFYDGAALPSRYMGGAFIGQHGSWNRSSPAGYKVVFVPFANGRPSGPPQDILTGFLDEEGKAQGRPVGVVVDRAGALLVADDVGNRVWRLTAVER